MTENIGPTLTFAEARAIAEAGREQGQRQAADQRAQAAANTYDPTSTTTYFDGESVRPTSMSSDAVDGASFGIDSDILRTARGANGGGPRSPHQVRGTDLVTYQGAEMTAQQAAEVFGLLVKGQDGFYRLPDGAAQPQQEPSQQEPQQAPTNDPGMASKIAAGDEPATEVNALVTAVNQHDPSGNATRAIVEDGLTNGTLSLQAVATLGARAGWSPEQAQQNATALWNGYKAQAERAAVSAGIADQPEALSAFFATAETTQRGELMNALRAMVYAGDVKPLRAMAKSHATRARQQG
jgi:hypothetical protein